MKKALQFLTDALSAYFFAWVMIITSPIWLPIWLAVKIYRYPREWSKP